MNRQVLEYYEKIIPCNLDYPYAFISYSNKDGNRVWKDVVELQDKGYNIWIDKNLKPTDSSWKEALNAIDCLNCKVVVFYISRNSVTSDACRQELLRRIDSKAKYLHNGEIPLVVIEAEPISSIVSFRNNVFSSVSKDLGIILEEKERKLEILGQVMDEFFPNDDKLRIKNAESERKGDYYKDITSCFDKVKCFDINEQFVNLIKLLKYPSNYWIARIYLIRAEKKNDLNFSLLLAFLYKEGIVVEKNKEKSDEFILLSDLMLDQNVWKNEADKCKKNQELERALVLYLGIAIQNDDLEGYMYAGKIFLNLDNYHFAKICLEKVKDTDEDCLKAYKAVKKIGRAHV